MTDEPPIIIDEDAAIDSKLPTKSSAEISAMVCHRSRQCDRGAERGTAAAKASLIHRWREGVTCDATHRWKRSKPFEEEIRWQASLSPEPTLTASCSVIRRRMTLRQ